jgi:hypothetical protein
MVNGLSGSRLYGQNEWMVGTNRTAASRRARQRVNDPRLVWDQAASQIGREAHSASRRAVRSSVLDQSDKNVALFAVLAEVETLQFFVSLDAQTHRGVEDLEQDECNHPGKDDGYEHGD